MIEIIINIFKLMSWLRSVNPLIKLSIFPNHSSFFLVNNHKHFSIHLSIYKASCYLLVSYAKCAFSMILIVNKFSLIILINSLILSISMSQSILPASLITFTISPLINSKVRKLIIIKISFIILLLLLPFLHRPSYFA